jgi:hypothetical protein
MDRRSAQRCPVCSGPAVEDKNSPDGLRCRNSACRHNHQNVRCPRCDASDLSQATYKNGSWSYTCSDCEHVWTKG